MKGGEERTRKVPNERSRTGHRRSFDGRDDTLRECNLNYLPQ